MEFLKLDGIHFKFSRYLKVSEVQVPELSANNNHIWIVEGTLPGKVHKNKKQKQTNFSSRGTYIMSGMYSMRAKSLYPVPNVTSSTLFLFLFFLLLRQASSFLMPYVRTSSKSRVDNSIIQVP